MLSPSISPSDEHASILLSLASARVELMLLRRRRNVLRGGALVMLDKGDAAALGTEQERAAAVAAAAAEASLLARTRCRRFSRSRVLMQSTARMPNRLLCSLSEKREFS